MNKNKHLVLNQRYEIEHSLNNRESFKSIGRLLDKDCTTIAKEVKSHIIFEKKGAPYRPFNDCLNRRSCYHYGDVCGLYIVQPDIRRLSEVRIIKISASAEITF